MKNSASAAQQSDHSQQADQEKLTALRHTTEHVLTQAMHNLYGQDQVIMAMGPATEDGFYFDFDSPAQFKLAENDFPKIEKEMQRLIKLDLPVSREEISKDQARKLFKNNPYKQEWLDELEEDKVVIYHTGNPQAKDSKNYFVDLCSGPHVSSTGKIKAFKLLSIAGAYWRGDENNQMLTRVYGTAFASKKALKDYLWQLEQAEQRNHRRIGKELGLF
ncbi:MAG: hypothetical protein GF390_00005, partial [Candidatus Pacebacteria bacterium]|nr:hypothetical protein [Candidatus Paceibacterota bacterium]